MGRKSTLEEKIKPFLCKETDHSIKYILTKAGDKMFSILVDMILKIGELFFSV